MFSADEMYPRIKGLQARIAENGWGDRKLYFAKVDILACFDSIPQLKLLELAEDIMEEDEYVTDKYTEVRRPSVNQVPSKNGVQWPVRKFQRCSRPTHEFALFAEFANTLSDNLKPGTVLVDGVEGWVHQKRELLKLLKDHIQHNIVRVGILLRESASNTDKYTQIGTDYYQQKTGIPQGSVVSPILTSFFYGAFENEKLAFTKSDDCLLVRLIDDFLLITLDRDKATRFLHVMHDGNPEYGAVVNPDKSLVNFETSVNGKKILRLVGSLYFPYCGYMLHTKTLDIKRDRQKDRLKSMRDPSRSWRPAPTNAGP